MTQRELGVMFTGRMVRAILEGAKTQTRRLIKVPAGWQVDEPVHGVNGASVTCRRVGPVPGSCVLQPPYGQPGARWWVREAWASHDGTVLYRADHWNDGVVGVRWRPSIFMARRQSRLELEVQRVRAERLQEISAADALSEGVEPPCILDNFQRLWDSINAKEPGRGWAANPWVWAYTFRVVRP